ncbi:MAG: tetratricopeptide repeat protein [Candidatus Brocadiaceae bacterium]|nr:tetratricopeptide repeat protein [Candidatus Brocadiaceae bacterium]
MKNITIYCDRIIVALLIAAIVVPPLFFDIRLYSVFDLSKVTALYMVTIAIVAIWAMRFAFSHSVHFASTRLDISILSYLSVFVIATIVSINPLMSLFGTYKRFEGLTATACYIFLFYVTVNFINTKKRAYLLVIAIVVGAVASSFYGIAQHLGFDFFKWSSFEARRVFSTFGNPVFFSAYLVMTLPLTVVLFFIIPFKQKYEYHSKKVPISWIYFVLSTLIYIAFWLTNTRACFIALLGGLIPLLILISKKIPNQKFKFVMIIVSFVLIGIFFNVRHETSVVKHFSGDFQAMDFSTGEQVLDQEQVHKRPWIVGKLNLYGSTVSRIFQYLSALMIIRDYPFFGIGPDTIGIVYQKNLAKVFSVQESDNGFVYPRQDRIHNDILDTTLTRGVFGLGTYVWVLFAFGMCVAKSYKYLNDQNRLFTLGLLAGIVCYLIQCEFSFGNTPIVSLFWIMMGLCISLIHINKKECGTGPEAMEQSEEGSLREVKQKRHQIPLPFRWICCGLALLLLAFVTTFIVRVYRADAYFEYGRRILEYEKTNLKTVSERPLFFLKRAVLMNPYETFYRDELCRNYIEKALTTKNEEWVEKAYIEANNTLQLIPQHFMGLFHLGMIYQMLEEHFHRKTADRAIDCYKKAIEVDPFQSPFHDNLASLYLHKGDTDLAFEELSQAYLIRPRTVRHVDRLANAFLKKGDVDKAVILARKAVLLEPAEAGYYNNLGALLSKKGLHEEAIDAFKKASELDPNEQVYLENLTKLYLSLHKYDELIAFYNERISRNPALPDNYNNLGVAYKRIKQSETAIPLFQKAVEMKPDNPVYMHNLAGAHVDVGKSAEAENMLRIFNEAYPDHTYVNIHLLLAELYSRNNNWEKVISECEQVITINEQVAAAYKMLGIAYYNTQQYERAGKILSQAVKLDPNDSGIKDLLTKITNKIEEDL